MSSEEDTCSPCSSKTMTDDSDDSMDVDVRPYRSSNLQHHNAKNNTLAFLLSSKKQLSLEEATELESSSALDDARCSELDQAFIYMIVKDNLSVSAGEREGMIEFSKIVAPGYTVPSACKATRLIEELAKRCREVMVKRLSQLKWIFITFDLVTIANSHCNYLVVTGHFLNEETQIERIIFGCIYMEDSTSGTYICERVKGLMETFNLKKEQVLSCSAYGGANIKLAVDILLGPGHLVNCFVHLNNLLVENSLKADAVKDIRNLISCVTDVLIYFGQNNNAMIQLRELEQLEGKTEGTDIPFFLDDETWNSSFDCLELYDKLAQHVSRVLTNDKYPNAPTLPSPAQLRLLKEVLMILLLFKAVTAEISVDTKVSGSLVIPLIKILEKSLLKLRPKTAACKKFVKQLQKHLEQYLHPLLDHHLLNLATLCDPRFKRTYLKNKEADNAVATLSKEIKNINIRRVRQAVAESVLKSPDRNNVDFILWEDHDRLAQEMFSELEQESGDPSELEVYLNRPIEPRSLDPIAYFNKISTCFPALSEVGLKYLMVMGASVLSEQAGSLLENTVPEEESDDRSIRNNLLVNDRVFLGSLNEKWLV